MRRVVVTGLGMVTPLACGVEPTWQRLIAGESGIGRIGTFEVSDLACKIAGQIPRGEGSNGSFNPDQWMEPKEQRKVDDFILFAMAAAKQALDDADWHPKEYEDQITSGVLIGSGIGGIEGIAAGPAGCRRSSFRAGSSTLRPATCRSRIRSKAPTARL